MKLVFQQYCKPTNTANEAIKFWLHNHQLYRFILILLGLKCDRRYKVYEIKSSTRDNHEIRQDSITRAVVSVKSCSQVSSQSQVSRSAVKQTLTTSTVTMHSLMTLSTTLTSLVFASVAVVQNCLKASYVLLTVTAVRLKNRKRKLSNGQKHAQK